MDDNLIEITVTIQGAYSVDRSVAQLLQPGISDDEIVEAVRKDWERRGAKMLFPWLDNPVTVAVNKRGEQL